MCTDSPSVALRAVLGAESWGCACRRGGEGRGAGNRAEDWAGRVPAGAGAGRWRQGGRGPGTHSVPAWLAQAGGGSVLSGWCPPTEGQVLFPLGTPTPTLQGPGIRPASWGPLPPGGWPPAACEGRGQADRPGWGGAGQALLSADSVSPFPPAQGLPGPKGERGEKVSVQYQGSRHFLGARGQHRPPH